MRNHYEDNIFDIKDFADILKQNDFNILEKKDSRIQFELGNDFFRLEDNSLKQYPDFISMKNDRNFIVATDTDYGIGIKDAIERSEEVSSLNNYSLQERTNYLKENLEGGYVKVPFKPNPNVQKLGNTIKDALKTKSADLQDINKIVTAVVDVLILMSNVYSMFKMRNSKSEALNEVMLKLNQKTSKSFARDQKLLAELPELKDVISKYEEFTKTIQIDQHLQGYDLNKFVAMKVLEEALTGEELEIISKAPNTAAFYNILTTAKTKIGEITDEINEAFPDLSELIKDNADEHLNLLRDLDSKPKELFEELGLDIKDSTARLEFILANNYFSRELLGDTSLEYDITLLNNMVDLETLDKIDLRNIEDIVSNIAEKILGLSMEETQQIKLKM